MKKLLTAAVIVSNMFLISCEPAATFNKPQPDNAKSLTSFPRSLQGKYLSADQTSILTITDRMITRQADYDYKEHKDSIRPDHILVHDTLVFPKEGLREKVVIHGDTIIRHADWTDTIFNLAANDVLKKFKGYYFLNNRHSDTSWEVKKLSLQSGQLIVGSISDKNDIQKLREITETTADTTSTHFALKRKEFKQFVKQQGFSELETFKKMN